MAIGFVDLEQMEHFGGVFRAFEAAPAIILKYFWASSVLQAGNQFNWIVGLTKLKLNLSIQSTQSNTPLHNQSINRVIQLIDKIELTAFSF
jgi:hypothetical protein